MTTKILNIYSYNLPRDVVIVLLFEPPNTSEVFQDQLAVVWRSLIFHKNGHSKATISYTPRIAFGYSQIETNGVVDATAWMEVKKGGVCSITEDEPGKRFGPAKVWKKSNHVVCRNRMRRRTDLSIGFVRGNGIDQRFEPTFIWMGVRARSSVVAQFSPVITAYVVQNHEDPRVLAGDIHTDRIWTCNLEKLDNVTGWNLIFDDDSGAFLIEPARHV